MVFVIVFETSNQGAGFLNTVTAILDQGLDSNVVSTLTSVSSVARKCLCFKMSMKSVYFKRRKII